MEESADWVQNRICLSTQCATRQSNAEQAPLEDNKGHHDVLMHITNEYKCKKKNLIKKREVFFTFYQTM